MLSGRPIPLILVALAVTATLVLPARAQWAQQGDKMIGSGPANAAAQGLSVAISADGNTAVVGGPNDYSNLVQGFGGVGAVWIYVRVNGQWQQQGSKLVGTLSLGFSAQGCSVAISADGNTVLVGGFNDNNGFGAAWVFTRTSNTWVQQGGKLVPVGAFANGQVGYAVALSADGNTAVLGAPQDNATGGAWIFKRSNGTWTQQGNKLLGSNSVSALQGTALSISADGNTLLMGGFADNSNIGAAWVFTRTNGVWSQQGNKLIGQGATSVPWEGYSVALSGDGNTALIGGPQNYNGIGSVWAFTRSNGVWTQQGNAFFGGGGTGATQQGWSVALSYDGNTALVGGFGDTPVTNTIVPAATGAVWTFTRNSGIWLQQGNKLTGTGAVNSTHAGGSGQAFSVALSADGGTMIEGGGYDNDYTGAVWGFSRFLATTHTGNFVQGQPNASYTINVHNGGSQFSSDLITVADMLPASLTAVSMSGSGWTCTLATVKCTRNDALAPGHDYPPITLTVSVSPTAPSLVYNQVMLSGAIPTYAIYTASDATVIIPAFSDISAGDPFLPSIDLMSQYAVTAGCGSGSPPTYCPNDNVTRGQMAVFVVRSVVGSENFPYTTTPYFTDVPANHPFFKWVQKMRDLGITAGCSVSAYCPDSAVSRGEMAVFIIRGRFGPTTTFTYPQTPYFNDVPANHPYFQWVQKMKQLAITSGCTSLTTYCPDSPVTRAQMAVFIMHGAFNQLLPDNTPVLQSSALPRAFAGQLLTVTLTGQNTTFTGGVSQVSFGPGITVTNVTVVNPYTLTAQLQVDSAAQSGFRSVTVTTGTEEATLPNGFQVQ